MALDPFPIADKSLRQALLARLAALRSQGAAGAHHYAGSNGGAVFGYCCFVRERIAQLRLADPLIVVVLSGAKELWAGERCERLPAGVPFVIPAGVTFDIVNAPDPVTGRYESVAITIDEDLRRSARRLAGAGDEPGRAGRGVSGPAIALTPDLVEAFGHAAAALTDPSQATALARHRILEILLLVRRAPAAAGLFAATIRARAEEIVRQDPGRTWRVEALARAMGLGASTLRRRLAAEGGSFRELLLETRMTTAQDLLTHDAYSVAQAAQAAGYSSRSHFARRFRAAHGVRPGRLRVKNA
ncbi:helix-turn-helix transcriptional regulator [Caulobacter hibisci]|uniref:Helix-turn-helix domain-containing protein n=1 Tax=Caulobacter hibisci TaxID=2035993 RepID=A0ABS0T2Q6_9CAUL|nr:helix-turn-helix domain-containing protein [Caulobacter hibisci]MBI1686016.1 helix-turn-helix domain-containing protein [Caulobacter hibisci]